jgi:uncharacterized protein
MRIGLVLAALAALPLQAAIPLPPAPTRYVTDAANVLDDEREHALNERLAKVDRETTNQLLVYVDRHVPEGTTLEEMGAEAIHTWAPGQKKTDNGAILFLFIDDRQSRIEVGYGLEGALTDAKSKEILVSMRPALRDGDITTAVEQGVDRILAVIGEPAAVQEPIAAPVRQYHAEEPNEWAALPAMLLLAGLIVVIIIVAKKAAPRMGRVIDSTDRPRDPLPPTLDSFSSSSSSSFDSSFSSSSSDASSSFSGGGGDGGGGGASDKW